MSYTDLAGAVEKLNDTNSTLVEAILQNQNTLRVADYEALSNYRGPASQIEITKQGISGKFNRLGGSSQTEVKGIFIKDRLNRMWGRVIEQPIEFSWFEPDTTGQSDSSIALQAFWSFLANFGLDGRIRSGTYSLISETSTPLDNSFSVICDTSVDFVALTGFPAGGAILRVTNSLNPNRTFKWIGGSFDGKQQPFSTSGSGSGCALLSVNASNCSHCHIEIDRTYTGDDWMNTGGDSHVFVGGARNVFIRVYEAIGAPDSAIYVSRNFAGEVGEALDVDGNFYKCMVGVIVKRQFTSAKVCATGVDCVTLASVGQADIVDYASTNGGSGYQFEVNAKRCQYPLFLQSVRACTGIINVDGLGISLPGYESSDASGVRLRGATDCQMLVNVSGVAPGVTVNTDYTAAFFGPIDNAKDGTVNSTGNFVEINARGLGQPFIESGSGTNNNTIEGKWDGGITNVPTIIGSNTRYGLQFGNLHVFNKALRKADNQNRIVWNVADDGSMSQGVRGSGAPAPVYTDMYSSGNTNRDGRIIVTGGTSVVDSGVLSLQFGQVSLLAPAVDFTNVARPAVTGVGTIGQASRVWAGGYTQTAFTVTSDERMKTDIQAIPPEVLDAWEAVGYYQYRLVDSVESKGESARTHTGLVAQRVRDCFSERGIDPFVYGILCFDKWDSEEATYSEDGEVVSHAVTAGERYSIRYEEALVLEAALSRRTMSNLDIRLKALEAKLAEQA